MKKFIFNFFVCFLVISVNVNPCAMAKEAELAKEFMDRQLQSEKAS